MTYFLTEGGNSIVNSDWAELEVCRLRGNGTKVSETSKTASVPKTRTITKAGRNTCPAQDAFGILGDAQIGPGLGNGEIGNECIMLAESAVVSLQTVRVVD